MPQSFQTYYNSRGYLLGSKSSKLDSNGVQLTIYIYTDPEHDLTRTRFESR